MKLLENKNIIFNYILSIILGMVLAFCCFNNSVQATSCQKEEIIFEPVIIHYYETDSIEEATLYLENAENRYNTALNIYENLILIGHSEDHPVVIMILRDIETISKEIDYYQKQVCELKWDLRKSEYPVAARVWLYMKNVLGWNDIVCAGVMGNLMAECGNGWGTDLRYNISSNGAFGMVQWTGNRKQELIKKYGSNPTPEQQTQFINDELYGLNGATKQVSDSQLNQIVNAETPEDCAYAFASYYERCSKQYKDIRKNYARKAYDYFVD